MFCEHFLDENIFWWKVSVGKVWRQMSHAQMGASSAERGEEKDKGEGERNIFRGKKNIKEKKTERVRRRKRKNSQ